MPRLSLSVPHALGVPEAVSRLRTRADAIRAAYQSQVTDLVESWDGDSMSCQFRVLGQRVEGALTVLPDEVQIVMDLPLFAMMFRGAIEARAREEMRFVDRYRYVVVNDDLDRAVDEVLAILAEQRAHGASLAGSNIASPR